MFLLPYSRKIVLDGILVLGLVISAMTMTDMISGLIIGRVVDIYTNTRYYVRDLQDNDRQIHVHAQ